MNLLFDLAWCCMIVHQISDLPFRLWFFQALEDVGLLHPMQAAPSMWEKTRGKEEEVGKEVQGDLLCDITAKMFLIFWMCSHCKISEKTTYLGIWTLTIACWEVAGRLNWRARFSALFVVGWAKSQNIQLTEIEDFIRFNRLILCIDFGQAVSIGPSPSLVCRIFL